MSLLNQILTKFITCFILVFPYSQSVQHQQSSWGKGSRGVPWLPPFLKRWAEVYCNIQEEYLDAGTKRSKAHSKDEEMAAISHIFQNHNHPPFGAHRRHYTPTL